MNSKDSDSGSGITPPTKRGGGSMDFSTKAAPAFGKDSGSYNDNQKEYSDLIDTMIQNDRENSDLKGLDGIRIYVKKMMSHSSMVGQIYDWSLVIMSAASCIMYVASTYIKDSWIQTLANIHSCLTLYCSCGSQSSGGNTFSPSQIYWPLLR